MFSGVHSILARLGVAAVLCTVFAAPARAQQYPACTPDPATATREVRTDTPVRDGFIPLCGSLVMTRTADGAQVIDALSGETVHAITTALGSTIGYMRSRHAVYFTAPGTPIQQVIEFNVGTGALRTLTLPRAATSVLAIVGPYLLVNTPLEPAKRYPPFYDASNNQMEILDPGQGTLMPVIGSEFGNGPNCVYFVRCGAYQEISYALGYPLSSRFVAATRDGSGAKTPLGTHDLDVASLVISPSRAAAAVQLGYLKWMTLAPDESHLLQYCAGTGAYFCYVDMAGDGSQLYERNNTPQHEALAISPDGRHVLSRSTRFQLAAVATPTTVSQPFTEVADTTRYQHVAAAFSPDGRYLIGLFRDTVEARYDLIYSPLPSPGAIPSGVAGFPPVLAGPAATAAYFPLEPTVRRYSTAGGLRSVTTQSVTDTPDGKEVVVRSDAGTFTYLVKPSGVFLLRIVSRQQVGTVTVSATQTFSPTLPVLPATAAAGNSTQASGTVRVQVPGYGETTSSYTAYLAVEGRSEAEFDGSVRPQVQVYTRFHYTGSLAGTNFAVRSEERNWYAEGLGLVRSTAYDPDALVSVSTYVSQAPYVPASDGGGGGGAFGPGLLLLLLPLAWWRRRRA